MVKVSFCRFQQSFLVLLPCLLWKRPLKRDSTDIYLITVFGDGNLGHTSTMRVIFFWKWSKFNVDFKNGAKNCKKSFVSERIVSELVALNFLHIEENTCHRQSMWQQTALRICIELTQTFTNWSMWTLMNKYGKGSVVQISTVFGPFSHVCCGRDL